MDKAHSLIQKYGFEKGFDVALEENLFNVAREIEAIENRMFGVYRNALSSTTQFPICANPLRVDLYNRCPFGCTYCFAGNTGKEILVNASVGRVTRDIENVFKNKRVTSGQRARNFATMARMGWPAHIGGMSDPMPPIELRKRIFYRTLLEFSKYDYPCIVSTKSNVPLRDKSYIDLFTDMKDRLIFQMSLITVDNYKFLEGNCIHPKQRLKTLEAICSRDVNCVVRVQPFMPQLIDEQKHLFKFYADIGVKGVIVEGLKIKRMLPSNKVKLALIRTFGIEIDNELTAQRYSKSIYPTETKVKYHRVLRDIAHNHGLQYYVADNNLRFMGDSPNCCGTDLINAKTNEYNITNLSYKHPDDFGYHLIKNIDNDYMQTKTTYARFKPKKRNIKMTLEHMYNDNDWMYDTYEQIYIDSDGYKHFRIKPEYR